MLDRVEGADNSADEKVQSVRNRRGTGKIGLLSIGSPYSLAPLTIAADFGSEKLIERIEILELMFAK